MKQEDQPTVTPDSSTTVNSKSDHDNSFIAFQVTLIVCRCCHNILNFIFFFQQHVFNIYILSPQEMFMDIYKWREKIEQQLMEVSNTVYGMLAMK